MLDFYKSFIDACHDFNYLSVLIRVVFSVVAGGVIGLERGKHGSAAGLRTHILVCLGACMSSTTSMYMIQALGIQTDAARLAAQVISGIGFLGAGMIIVKNTSMVTGLTTAAGLWATGTIGIAIGFTFYFGAFLGTIACVFTAAFLTRFERKQKMLVNLYAEISDTKFAGKIFDEIHNNVMGDVLIEAIPAKSGIDGNLGYFITISDAEDFVDLRQKIEAMEGVAFVMPE